MDAILDQSRFDLFGGYLTDCVDAFIFNEASLFQSILNETCETIKTSYACLMLNGRLIAASNAWNELNSAEKYLISLLTLTLNPSTSYDIPIYLPYKSPRVRLMFYSLKSLKYNNFFFRKHYGYSFTHWLQTMLFYVLFVRKSRPWIRWIQ